MRMARNGTVYVLAIGLACTSFAAFAGLGCSSPADQQPVNVTVNLPGDDAGGTTPEGKKPCDLNGESFPDGAEIMFGSTDTGECQLGREKCTDGAWSVMSAPVEPAIETCDGLDNDCDGVVDNDTLHPGHQLPDCIPCNPTAVEACGDHIDNNCNGEIDEGCPTECDPATDLPRSCVVAGLKAACAYGQMTCQIDGTWSTCFPTVLPETEVCGDKKDNDCDGQIDNGCSCEPGDTVTCPTGTPGVCMIGTSTCGQDEKWGLCAFANVPVEESCGSDGGGNGKDDNCDGQVDEGCSCDLGETEYCETSQLGLCIYGKQECESKGTGTEWGTCVPLWMPETDTCGDGLDEDCDGTPDDGCACTPGTYLNCQTGLPGTCSAGRMACKADGTGYTGVCEQLVKASLDVCANGLDEDCDGQPDDGCECDPTDPDANTQPCMTGIPGECAIGHQQCLAKPGTGGEWGNCIPDKQPAKDVCGNGLDENCDGVTDDHCPTVCTPNKYEVCMTGQPGICQYGTKKCNAFGNGYSDCLPLTFPMAEICGDGIDEDCDGTVDNGCACAPGSSIDCQVPGEKGVCSKGKMECLSDGTGYTGVCEPKIGPTAEVCGDGIDQDCDGQPDDGCVCTAGAAEYCDTGLPGVCILGRESCLIGGNGWGTCVPLTMPSDEVCGNGIDDDCDGSVDEGCATVCEPDATEYCDTGLLGMCTSGSHACLPDGSAYGACVPAHVAEPTDTCGDALDNDCDGSVDEGCVCVPGTSIGCPVPGQLGTCADGLMTCDASGASYGPCVQIVGPAPDSCGDGIDQDCDGTPDDSCACDPAAADQDCNTQLPGVCKVGTQTCHVAAGKSFLGPCKPIITPGHELCANGLDDDCDGAVDEADCVTP